MRDWRKKDEVGMDTWWIIANGSAHWRPKLPNATVILGYFGEVEPDRQSQANEHSNPNEISIQQGEYASTYSIHARHVGGQLETFGSRKIRKWKWQNQLTRTLVTGFKQMISTESWFVCLLVYCSIQTSSYLHTYTRRSVGTTDKQMWVIKNTMSNNWIGRRRNNNNSWGR